MMRTIRRTQVAATLLVCGASACCAQGSRVEVFTLSTLPLTHVGGASVYYLDAVALLEQQLSADLPSDAARAQQIVNQRLQALEPQLQARSHAGAVGLARAAQLGLQRAPAIVFDGRWAVYGFTDVDLARKAFTERMQAEGRQP